MEKIKSPEEIYYEYKDSKAVFIGEMASLTKKEIIEMMKLYHSQFSSPQEVGDNEIFQESKKLGDFAMEAGFSSGAKWMRSKLTNK